MFSSKTEYLLLKVPFSIIKNSTKIVSVVLGKDQKIFLIFNVGGRT